MIQTYLHPKFCAEKEYRHMIHCIKNTFDKATDGIVIGISGGKDSSVAAKLFVDAIGAERVHGVIMPNGTMKDLDFALRVCDHLGIAKHIIDISPVYEAELNILSNSENITDTAKVNLLPRIRMMTLYAIAQTLGLRVTGTGNLSEAAVGYCTKWGDMASDFNPLASYTCSEVIEIGRYCLPEWIANKIPEDGLWGRTDEDNLGFTYAELDKLIRDGEKSENYIVIANRIKASQHKLRPIPCIQPVTAGNPSIIVYEEI